MKREKNYLFDLVFLVVLFLCLFASIKKPLYNWDLIPYTALAIESSHTNPAQLHDQTYNTIQHELPSNAYHQLNSPAFDPYRQFVATNPDSFSEQLPYYRYKLLYIWLINFLYFLGISPVFSSHLLSALSVFTINLILYFLARKRFNNKAISLLIGIIVTASPFQLEIARLSTPDALGNLFMICFFLSLFSRKIIPLTIFGILAILTRIDYILILLISMVIWNINEQNKKIWIALIIVIASAILIKYTVGMAPWKSIITHTFLERTLFPITNPPSFDIIAYAKILFPRLLFLLFPSSILLFILLVLKSNILNSGILYDNKKIINVIIINISSIFVHFLIFPKFDLRVSSIYFILMILPFTLQEFSKQNNA